jgi:hypothetical protein
VYSIKIKDIKAGEVQTKVDLVVSENVFHQMNITRVRVVVIEVWRLDQSVVDKWAKSGLIWKASTLASPSLRASLISQVGMLIG